MKEIISNVIIKSIKEKYNLDLIKIEINITKKNFYGDYSIHMFRIFKLINDDNLIAFLVNKLMKCEIISDYNYNNGFLNIVLNNSFVFNQLNINYKNLEYGICKINKESKTFLIEFSSPNTNKPLHLGHIRNNLIGESLSRILIANGINVIKTQLINDRGIHICKSMVGWIKYANGETPKSTMIKGDHFVGKYYVKFNDQYNIEVKDFISKGYNLDYAKKNSPILLEAKNMLIKWERGDPDVLNIWNMLNKWVYDGFKYTYDKLGVSFDFSSFESKNYLLGKDIILKAFKEGILYKRDDGAICISLKEYNIHEDKVLLRSDGTSVYITQDIGTAFKYYSDYNLSKIIYVVGSEQNHHFKILFLILKKLGFYWSEKLIHMSYGMVDLPTGKMKSREGNVIDADNLIDNIYNIVKNNCNNNNRLLDLSEEDRENIYNIISMGALKYFILKIDSKKRILFNVNESIDLNGNTGSFIQYCFVRIKSMIDIYLPNQINENLNYNFLDIEKNIILFINEFPSILRKASLDMNPSLIANYIYELVKMYNFYYQNNTILKMQDTNIRDCRLAISCWVSNVIRLSLHLLGIDVPNKM